MRKLIAVLVVVVFGVGTLGAQSAGPACTPPPSPGPGWVQQDCGWLPLGHPAIRTVATVPAVTVSEHPGAKLATLPVPPALAGCEVVNPYADPDHAADCVARYRAAHPAPVVVKEFVLGAVYGRPYGERKILVIGRALGLDGREVITAQVVYPESERGTPVAFVNDGGIVAGQWWPVAP